MMGGQRFGRRIRAGLVAAAILLPVLAGPSSAVGIAGPGFPADVESKLACTAEHLDLAAASDVPTAAVSLVDFLMSITDSYDTPAVGTLDPISTSGTVYPSDWTDEQLAAADAIAAHYGITRDEAIAYSVALVVFLSALGGACAAPAATPPGPSSGLTVTNRQSATVTVSWQAPAWDGGAAITGYRATAANATDSFSCATAGGLSCVITGLEFDTDYTVTVTADNTAGTSQIQSASIHTALTPELLSDLACSTNQIAKWDGTNWTCTTDSLTGLSCSVDQIAKWNGYRWDCATDTLAGMSCSTSQIARWTGTGWECQTSLAGLSCYDQQVARWNTATNAWECDYDRTGGGSSGLQVAASCASGEALYWSDGDGIRCQWTNTTITNLFQYTGSSWGSMTIGTDGNPVIAHYDATGLNIYVCAALACTSGTARALDAIGEPNGMPSIVIGSDNNPVIAYRDETNDDLKVYVCANTACSSGTARTLASTGNVGRRSSLAIGNDNNPVIAYLDETNGDLKLYICADTACSSGTARTLASNPSGNIRFMDVAIGSDNNPVISFIYFDMEDSNGTVDLKLYACGDTSCSSGSATTLDTKVSGESSIAIGSNGNPIIAYNDSSDLGIYVCANTTCSSGTSLNPYLRGATGYQPDIAIRNDGRPVIAFQQYDTADLKLHVCADTTCSTGSTVTIDFVTTGGMFPSVALDNDGKLAVFYSNADPQHRLAVVTLG